MGSAFMSNPDSTKSTICPRIFTPIQKASFAKGLFSFFIVDIFLIFPESLKLLLSLVVNGAGFSCTVLVTNVSALILSC